MWQLGIFRFLAEDQNVLNMAPHTGSWLGENWLGFFGGFFFHVCCLKGWELNSCTVSRNRFLLVWLYLELQSEDLRV